MAPPRRGGQQEALPSLGWTARLRCRGCAAELACISINGTWIDPPKSEGKQAGAVAALDWRLFLAAVPDEGNPGALVAAAAAEGDATRGVSSALRCARCNAYGRLVELLGGSPASSQRWVATILGEAVTLELQTDRGGGGDQLEDGVADEAGVKRPRGPAPAQPLAPDPQLTPTELLARWRSGEARFLIDLRPASDFAARHLRGSTSLPWWALEKGASQLPVTTKPVLLVAPLNELGPALVFWHSRGRALVGACAADDALWTAAAAADTETASSAERSLVPNSSTAGAAAGRPGESGVGAGEGSAGKWGASEGASATAAQLLPLLASEAEGSFSKRAWAASPLLERHLQLLRPSFPDSHPDFLLHPDSRLYPGSHPDSRFYPDSHPGSRTRAPLVLDLGCGSGRDAVFLAAHGWAVVAADSDARALARVVLLAAAERSLPPAEALELSPGPPGPTGLPGPIGLPDPTGLLGLPLPDSRTPGPAAWAQPGVLRTLRVDLSRDAGICTLSAFSSSNRIELVLFVRYLNRSLLMWTKANLPVGGAVAISHFLRGAELVGRRTPRLPEDMLQRGELRALFMDNGTDTGAADTGAVDAGTDAGAADTGAVVSAVFQVELEDEAAQAEDGRPMVNFIARRVQ
ncbi:hypothetical protein T492DRAFT_957594 [Pavlovales sp. CCMP2436]|nr:hypothetical protein T492DRAFT_957594 [Pavlovales sp. CCMP2436]